MMERKSPITYQMMILFFRTTLLFFSFAISLVLAVQGASAQGVAVMDYSTFFRSPDGKPISGAFVCYNQAANSFTRHDTARCARRFSPFATFDVANSLIGLETAAIPDTSTIINWDRKKYPPTESWMRNTPQWLENQTMRTALQYSVLWYYRELSRRVGERDMKRYVELFGYGNKDVSGGFFAKPVADVCWQGGWAGGSLRVSADEQVSFLRRVVERQLPVGVVNINMVKDLLTLEETDRYRLCGKAGSGLESATGKVLGWFVGWVESTSVSNEKNTYYFALNLDGATLSAVRDNRIVIAKRLLKELGALPK
jgi:beta-lactamase class D